MIVIGQHIKARSSISYEKCIRIDGFKHFILTTFHFPATVLTQMQCLWNCQTSFCYINAYVSIEGKRVNIFQAFCSTVIVFVASFYSRNRCWAQICHRNKSTRQRFTGFVKKIKQTLLLSITKYGIMRRQSLQFIKDWFGRQAITSRSEVYWQCLQLSVSIKVYSDGDQLCLN